MKGDETVYQMSKEELFELHKQTAKTCLEVMIKKNHDYTSGGSVFANFKDSAILGVHPVLGILIRCIDKFKRVQTYATKGGLLVEGEGVLDAIDDTINYLILAKGIIIEEQASKELHGPCTCPD
jgi:hypothetical protein